MVAGSFLASNADLFTFFFTPSFQVLFSNEHFTFISFSGYRGVTANFTYSWKPVNNTNFAVCIVVASSELDTKVTYLIFLSALTGKFT